MLYHLIVQLTDETLVEKTHENSSPSLYLSFSGLAIREKQMVNKRTWMKNP
ncbi:hypothetical protein LguiB_011041 [Lonicera macranthoides]